MAKATAKAAPHQYGASHRYARISPRKARLVADLIRGEPVGKALQDLRYCWKRGAPMVSKVLRSAINNATQLAGLEATTLYVSTALVNEGPTIKRWKPRAMGRAYPRMKRTCHIEVAVAEMPADLLKKIEASEGKKKPAAVVPADVEEPEVLEADSDGAQDVGAEETQADSGAPADEAGDSPEKKASSGDGD